MQLVHFEEISLVEYDIRYAHFYILEAFRKISKEYFLNDLHLDWEDKWELASNQKKWKLTEKSKRKLIPAIKAYQALIEESIALKCKFIDYEVSPETDKMYDDLFDIIQLRTAVRNKCSNEFTNRF